MNPTNQKRPQFKIADELDEVSFWDDCAREVKNHHPGNRSHVNQSGSHGKQSGSSCAEGGAPKKKDREEVREIVLKRVEERFFEWNLQIMDTFGTSILFIVCPFFGGRNLWATHI